MEQIKECVVKKVFKNDQSKDGKKFIDKNGKGYWKVAVMIDDETKYRSCLVFNKEDRAFSLQEGDKLTLKLYSSGDYLNFDVPTKKEIEIIEMKNDIAELKRIVGQLVSQINGESTDKERGYHYTTTTEAGIKPEDVPF